MKKYKLEPTISGIDELIYGNYYVCDEDYKTVACIIKLHRITNGIIYANGVWFDNNEKFESTPYNGYATLNGMCSIRPATKEEIEKYLPEQ